MNAPLLTQTCACSGALNSPHLAQTPQTHLTTSMPCAYSLYIVHPNAKLLLVYVTVWYLLMWLLFYAPLRDWLYPIASNLQYFILILLILVWWCETDWTRLISPIWVLFRLMIAMRTLYWQDDMFITGLRGRSLKEWEVFGWSRISKNTRSRIFFIRFRKSNLINFYIVLLS